MCLPKYLPWYYYYITPSEKCLSSLHICLLSKRSQVWSLQRQISWFFCRQNGSLCGKSTKSSKERAHCGIPLQIREQLSNCAVQCFSRRWCRSPIQQVSWCSKDFVTSPTSVTILICVSQVCYWMWLKSHATFSWDQLGTEQQLFARKARISVLILDLIHTTPGRDTVCARVWVFSSWHQNIQREQ